MVERQDHFPKKIDYFSKLATRVRPMLRLHKELGLWAKGEQKGTNEDWRNVTDHCLAEVARCDVLANALQLSPEAKENLLMAAAVHDFFKKSETEILKMARANGTSEFDAFTYSEDEARKVLEEAGVDPSIIRIAQAIGHPSLLEIQAILKKDKEGGILTEEELAMLVLHFVDDISVDDKWVDRATISSDTRNAINILDMRMDKLENNPKYAKLNQEGKKVFRDEEGNPLTCYEAQRKIGHAVEECLTRMVNKLGVMPVSNPLQLAEEIDDTISVEIKMGA